MSEKDKQLTAYAGYDEFAQQYEAAYRAFAATYELRTPRPEKPKRRWDNAGVLLALAVMLLAQVIVSGSRTIKEFGEVGGAAFVMLEVGMVTFAFIRTSRDYDESRHVTVLRWVGAGLLISFMVLLSGNIDATLKSKSIHLPDWVNVAIQLAIAVSAPVLAFITGDVLGMYVAMQSYKQRKAQEKYEEDYKEWGVGLANSWKSQKSQWGVKIEVQREPVRIHSQRSLPEYANEQGEQYSDIHSRERSVNAANGYRKNMNASDLIREFLNDHSERSELWTMTADEFHGELLNAGIKVGRTKAYEIRRELDAQR